jgi:D-alanyl-D-alanine carboxypeptidase
LLETGQYTGLKTGITPTAGPCLAASLQKDDFRLIVVVLNCKSMEHRWSEVQKLVQWAMFKVNKVRESELKPKLKKQMLKKLVHI